jgi:hypothetical protein
LGAIQTDVVIDQSSSSSYSCRASDLLGSHKLAVVSKRRRAPDQDKNSASPPGTPREATQNHGIHHGTSKWGHDNLLETPGKFPAKQGFAQLGICAIGTTKKKCTSLRHDGQREAV